MLACDTTRGSSDAPGGDAAGSVAVPNGASSYPGGKSGAGIFQRLINLIPQHRVLVSAFAGHCGLVRNIKPADHTIVIDRDEDVCQWWDDWRRSPEGRRLEIHHCDSIEWLRHWFGQTEYSAARSTDTGSGDASRNNNGSRNRRLVMTQRDRMTQDSASAAGVAVFGGTAATHGSAAEAFVFCDPPYVMSERAHGKQYACEMTDSDHRRLLEVLTTIDATRYLVMVCGYACPLYAALDPWRSIDHRVPTRGGLQDERLWLNYERPVRLHDYRYVGNCRRSREKVRRRQKNWVSQLNAMGDREREAMLEAIRHATRSSG